MTIEEQQKTTALQMMLLDAFTDHVSWRQTLREPWSSGNYTYATDRIRIIRVHRKIDVNFAFVCDQCGSAEFRKTAEALFDVVDSWASLKFKQLAQEDLRFVVDEDGELTGSAVQIGDAKVDSRWLRELVLCGAEFAAIDSSRVYFRLPLISADGLIMGVKERVIQ